MSSELPQPDRLLTQRILALVTVTIRTATAAFTGSTATIPVNAVHILQYKAVRTRGTGCNDTDITVCTEANPQCRDITTGEIFCFVGAFALRSQEEMSQPVNVHDTACQ